MVQVSSGEAPAEGTFAAFAGGTSMPPRFMPDFSPELDRLVRGLAGQLHSRLPRGCGIEVSDLIQAGNVGLLQAAQNFEPAQGAPLAGFAKFRIRGEMLDMVRRHSGRSQAAGRNKTVGAAPEEWEAIAPAAPDSSPQEKCLDRQRTQILNEELDRLSARDRMVVRLRYSRQMTLRQIGTELQVNESRVCQIHQTALSRLKRGLSSRGVRELAHL